MRITIIDGDGAGEPTALDGCLVELTDALRAGGHAVTLVRLRELELRTCIGCLDCLVKRPGECSRPDDLATILRAVLDADFLLWAAPLSMGFPSSLLKLALERLTELRVRPWGSVVDGEVHHVPRYPRNPPEGLLLATEPDTDTEDVAVVADIFGRSALAVGSHLAFVRLSDASTDDIVAAITASPSATAERARPPAPTVGVSITPPTRLTVFNGSPRGRRSNTMALLEPLLRGFVAAPDRSYEVLDLVRQRQVARFVEAFAAAECALLAFPLYADSMPTIVKAFVESLAPLRARGTNPPLAFLVQGGFPEATHSRYVERYLERLARRLGSPYLGTIVKGGSEMRRDPSAVHRAVYDALFANWGVSRSLEALGRSLADGYLDHRHLHRLARLERYPRILVPLLRVSGGNPLVNHYWDVLLKRAGAYERRDATPFAMTDVGRM